MYLYVYNNKRRKTPLIIIPNPTLRDINFYTNKYPRVELIDLGCL